MNEKITNFKENLIGEYVNFVSEDVNKKLNGLMMDLMKTGRSFTRDLLIELCKYNFKEEVSTLTEREIENKLIFEFYNEDRLLESDADFDDIESVLGMFGIRLKIKFDRIDRYPIIASFNLELRSTEYGDICCYPITQEEADIIYRDEIEE